VLVPKRAPRRSKRTETDKDLVRLYLDEIGHYELLTKDGEVRLARRIEAGSAARAELGNQTVMRARHRELEALIGDGEEATRQFVQANLRLVVSIAKKYRASGVPLLDLIQEGNLGLIHAVEKFEWRKGFKFSTYATWWVRQAIQRGIANTGRTIRVPVSAGDRLSQVLKLRERLEAELGRAPRTAELATEADMSESALAELLRCAVQIRSLSETPDQHSEIELGELLADPLAAEPFAAAAETMLVAELEHLLALLDPDEQQVLRLRFGIDRGEPRSLEEVANQLGVDRAAVRRLENRGLSKLRHPSSGRDLHGLLAAG
jgi:RNA polymerase sigma factor (sigma-70 family)